MIKKDYYTTSEVAKILKVAVGSVINWVDDGKIKAIVTPGGHRKIPYKELVEFLEKYNYDNLLDKAPKKKLVYLIDDEDSTHDFFKKIFGTSSEYEIVCFYSGTDALIEIGKVIPHIIVVDILMPDIDGIQVIKKIKSKPELNEVRIISISADISKKDIALEAGANLFLKKPFDMAELKKILLETGI